MIKRTIEISQHPTHLALRRRQLCLRRHGDNGSAPLIGTIPCEDIGLVLVDHPQTTYSHAALAALAEAGAAVLICGPDHLPAALMLPLADHTEVVWRVREQTAATEPRKKRLWQQIVVAKVHGQAANVSADATACDRLMNLAGEVRSGDTTNVEAQAAKAYWAALRAIDPLWVSFHRNPDGTDPLNAMLNYGYAVMRAAVARALVAAGLQPALGIHHTNRSNAFCLADDLVEPLRPVVDASVRCLLRDGAGAIDTNVKKQLLCLLQAEFRCGDQAGPLGVGLHRYAASLVQCLRGQAKRLDIPMPTGAADA